MAKSRIPVDLFNPGQVFACLGFMELADTLLGDAEAGFDWSDSRQAQFCLSAAGEKNPFEVVLEFLNAVTVRPLRPAGVDGEWPQDAVEVEAFPAPLSELKGSMNGLPITLQSGEQKFSVSSWLESGGRNALKLFSGNQVAKKVMISLLTSHAAKLDEPFKTEPVDERFGYDSRGAWDAINAGFSLNDHKSNMTLLVSPLVEALAAVGLEHTRPEFISTYEIRYAVWRGKMPVGLARAVFTQPQGLMPSGHFRCFRSHLGDSQYYKKCFPSTEELSK